MSGRGSQPTQCYQASVYHGHLELGSSGKPAEDVVRVFPSEWQESWRVYPPALMNHQLKAVPKSS